MCGQLEVVVRPAQSLTPSNSGTKQLDILVVIQIGIIVDEVVTVVAHTAIVAGEVVHPCRVVVGAVHVRLLGEEGTDVKRVGAFATKPVSGVSGTVRLVVLTIGLSRQGELLTVASRQYTSVHLVLAEEVTQREVVELDTHTANDTRLSPTERELQLVVRFLLQVPVDINGSVIVVGLDIGTHLLRIKESHGGYLTCRTLKGILREKVARLSTQLTAHHFLVETVVTEDAYIADVSLHALADTHLQVDGVSHNVDLSGFQVVEQVTRVPVQVAHCILVFSESLVQERLVVDVTLLHAEHLVEVVGGIDCITHPGNVAEIIALAFVHLDKDVDMILVSIPHGVFQDDGIAETQLVVFLDEVLLISRIAFVSKLL